MLVAALANNPVDNVARISNALEGMVKKIEQHEAWIEKRPGLPNFGLSICCL